MLLLSACYSPSIEEMIIVNSFICSVRRHGKVAFAAFQDGLAVKLHQVVLTLSQSELYVFPRCILLWRVKR